MNEKQICELCLLELELKISALFNTRQSLPPDHCFVCQSPAVVAIDLDEHADKLAGPCPEHG
jgi:hypothetical protein